MAVKRACEKLESDLGGKLPLQDIAVELGLSVSHFPRAFRASVGLPPHQWLLRQRVGTAKQLMTIRGLSLAGIAISAGFANQSHFTRVFSAVVGVSPAVWRREMQGGLAKRGLNQDDGAVASGMSAGGSSLIVLIDDSVAAYVRDTLPWRSCLS